MHDHRGLMQRPRADATRDARHAVAGRIAAGAEAYERGRHLARVIAVGPEEIADLSSAGSAAILRKLARALRAERMRGRAGHWTYDLNRHIALNQAYMAERAAYRGKDGSRERK